MHDKIQTSEQDKDLLFSRVVKAGKRVYYLDVKKNRLNELYLCITESKKQRNGTADDSPITYEKHKIFLFPEDFKNFSQSLQEATQFITSQQGETMPRKSFNPDNGMD